MLAAAPVHIVEIQIGRAPREADVPSKTTIHRARKDLAEGKRPTTAAGEFVREEMEHVRRGKHGARSRRQVVAIGLSQARRAGIPVPPRRKSSAKRGRRALARAEGRALSRRPAVRRYPTTRSACPRSSGHFAAAR